MNAVRLSEEGRPHDGLEKAMQENPEEEVSALLDGELRGRQLQEALDRLQQEPQRRERWHRYNLISDALRGNLPPYLSEQVQERVSRALESEPHILAPRRRFPHLARQAAGLAIAASVSAVAILALQQNGVEETPPAAALAERSDSSAAPSVVALDPPQQPVPQNDSHLSPYLVNHNEYSASTGMQGMIPYMRIVGQQPQE